MGARPRPVTKSQPKEMLPMTRKPIVQCLVEEGGSLPVYGERYRAFPEGTIG
jgi:UTP-glucose-1-phosphate uridylyltransferase